MLIRSISRPSQQSNVFLCQKILNNVTFVTGDDGSIMHENVALINKYTQLPFCFQFDTFFALCGHFRRHIVGNCSSSSWHSPKPSELQAVSLHGQCISCGAVSNKVAKHVAREHETAALKISQKTALCTSPLMSSYGELWHGWDTSLSSGW